MGLISKEEERIKIKKDSYKKMKQFLSMKREILLIDNTYKNIINEFENKLNTSLDFEDVDDTFFRILIKMEIDPRFFEILRKLNINKRYLFQLAIEYICAVDPSNEEYSSILKEILEETHIEEYEESNGNFTITNINDAFNVNRMFKFQKRNKWKDVLKFSSVLLGEQSNNCHQFNTTFYDWFPKGNVVTGNISIRFRDIRLSHTWVEDDGNVFVPNLNYSTSLESYYLLFDPTDCVIIPYSRINADRMIRMKNQQMVNLYDYLRNPNEIMAKLK